VAVADHDARLFDALDEPSAFPEPLRRGMASC
jgi:hypothetical protein